MRFFTLFIAIITFFSNAFGQSLPVRQMDSKLIGKDSVNIYYDEHYKIIESGCAGMIRFGHLDSLHRHFIGKFKDVSKNDSVLIVSEGNYAADGLKNGAFIVHYLKGTLQAKGYFKNDNYEGEWVFYDANGQLREKSNFENGRYEGKCEFYNEDGSPSVFMLVKGNNCRVTDAWGTDGKKTVNEGNGDYVFYDGSLIWQGKLASGIPDSVWTFKVSNDVYGNEFFEKGSFREGTNHTTMGISSYNDHSRIKYAPPTPPKLAILNADKLRFADYISCDGTDYSKYHKWQTKFLGKLFQTTFTPLPGSHWQK